MGKKEVNSINLYLELNLKLVNSKTKVKNNGNSHNLRTAEISTVDRKKWKD